MNEQFESDLNARERIVRDLSTNFFVEAGAGSGKTTVLVRRMVSMVESGTDVSRICAITFTKAAAGEFYSRFQKALIERSTAEAAPDFLPGPGELGSPTDETRARCRQALRNIDLCFMGTIDAFCNMIISEHPAEADVPANSRVCEDREMAQLYRREYSRIQNGERGERLKTRNRQFRALFRNPDEVFLETLGVLMEHRNADFRFTVPETEDIDSAFAGEKEILRDLAAALLRNRHYRNDDNAKSGKAWDALEEKSGILSRKWRENFPEILNLIKKITDLRLIPQADPDVLGAAAGELIEPHYSRNRLGWYQLSEEWFKALRSRMERYQYDMTMYFVSGCVPVIAGELKKEGALSFFDYMLYLRDMLKRDASGDGRLIRHVAGRHSCYLIDEFQDTNPMQAEIFFYLTAQEPKPEWRDCVPVPGSLFIVGDPKQSIYRFRSADVSSYLSVRELFTGGAGEVLRLSRNFRSTCEVSSWFNRVFAQMMPADTENQSRFEPIPLPENAPEQGTFGGIYTYESTLEAKAAPEEKDPARVLKIISGLVHDPEKTIRERKDGTLREISYGDFMLITPGKAKLAEYTSLFAANRIPFRVEGKIVFRECPALCALTGIYLAAAFPNEAMYLYGALTGPYFRMRAEDLLRLKAQGLTMGIFAENADLSPDEPVLRYLAELRDLHFRATDLTPTGLFDRILEDFDICRYTGAQNLEYLYYAAELLRSAEKDGTAASPEDGACFLKELITDEQAAERCMQLSRNRDCVHIANLHKVKGLEAPVVILAAQRKGNSVPQIRVEQTREGASGWIFSNGKSTVRTDAYPEQEEAEKRSSEAEKIRLLYVAATRAGNALIIGDVRTVDGKHSGHNVWMPLAEQADADIFCCIREQMPAVQPPESVSAEELYGTDRTPDMSDSGPRRGSFDLRRPSMIRMKALTATEDELEDMEAEEIRSDRRKRSPALTGTAVHRLMEMLVSSRNRIDLDSAVREIARQYGAEDSYYTDILQMTGEKIRNGGFPQKTDVPQDILTELLSAEEIHCELPFCYLDEDGTELWHGVMDVLYRKDGKWHIVDYKTNADPEDLDVKYQEQLQAYITAFRRMAGEEADALIYHIDVG